MRRAVVPLSGALIVAIVLALIFADALFEITRLSPRSRLFPLATALPGLAVALLAVVHEIRRPPPALPPEAAMTLRALAWFAAFFAGMFVLGFTITSALFTAVYLYREAELPWPIAIGGAVAGTAVALIFASTLHVPLPEGFVAPLLPRIGG